MRVSVIGSFLLSALVCSSAFVTSCALLGASSKSGSKGTAKSAKSTVSAGQVVSVKVDERDLLLKDELTARNYLTQKLEALMAKDLISLGFEGKKALEMAKSAQRKDIFVRGHMERIMGQGKDAGKISDETLWDVRGQLHVSLSDSVLDHLFKDLSSRPVSTMEDVSRLESIFDNMDKKGIDNVRFDALRKKVADKWAALLQPWEKKQFEIPLRPLDSYLKTLKRVSMVLESFYRVHPKHPGFARLEKMFTLAAIKAVRSIEVKSENFEAIRKVLAEIQEIAGGYMPGLMGYIKRDLELAWRDYLVAMDDKKVAFPKMREGFVYFLELFPKSQFYPDLELRFLSRWYDHLLSFAPKDVKELDGMLRQVKLMHDRFPSFDGLKDLELAAGKHCVSILSLVKAPDLKFMAKINDTLSKCEPFLQAGNKTVQMRDHLENMEQALTDARDDDLEKRALANLDFFIQWDKAITSLPWGTPKKRWKTHSRFMEKWKTGKDAGAECRCTLDPEEPCRIFDGAGLAGGFEVVVRFTDEKLSGVDLCEVYTGNKMEAIYRFFARRYKALHSGRQAAQFLAGTRNGTRLSFIKDDKVHLTLERTTDTCTIRYRSVKMMTEAEKKEKERAAKEAKAREEARRERVLRGWSPGQCVRWECKPVCQYRGRTKTRKDDRYMVTITQSRKSPTEEGSEVWVSAEDLYDCP